MSVVDVNLTCTLSRVNHQEIICLLPPVNASNPTETEQYTNMRLRIEVDTQYVIVGYVSYNFTTSTPHVPAPQLLQVISGRTSITIEWHTLEIDTNGEPVIFLLDIGTDVGWTKVYQFFELF